MDDDDVRAGRRTSSFTHDDHTSLDAPSTTPPRSARDPTTASRSLDDAPRPTRSARRELTPRTTGMVRVTECAGSVHPRTARPDRHQVRPPPGCCPPARPRARHRERGPGSACTSEDGPSRWPSQHRMPARTRSQDAVAGGLLALIHDQAASGVPPRTSRPCTSVATDDGAGSCTLVHSALSLPERPLLAPYTYTAQLALTCTIHTSARMDVSEAVRLPPAYAIRQARRRPCSSGSRTATSWPHPVVRARPLGALAP